MKRHYVTFMIFGAEEEPGRLEIASWDRDLAKKMAKQQPLSPYAFQFSTRERNDNEMDSREVARSSTIFLGGVVETLEEVEARNDPSEKILRENMRAADYRIIRTRGRVLAFLDDYEVIDPDNPEPRRECSRLCKHWSYDMDGTYCTHPKSYEKSPVYGLSTNAMSVNDLCRKPYQLFEAVQVKV